MWLDSTQILIATTIVLGSTLVHSFSEILKPRKRKKKKTKQIIKKGIRIQSLKIKWKYMFYLGKDKSPEVLFMESLHIQLFWSNLNFCANSARSKTWSRKNISWKFIKSLLTKLSNVLPFYASSQNSNLLYCEVDFLKGS